MSLLQLVCSDGHYAFDEAQCRTAGKELATRYQSASPFPHIVIDDFISADLLKNVAEHYPSTDDKAFFDRSQERFKFQFHPQESNYSLTRNLFAELNGHAFLGFMEEMTGISGLIPDPYFVGGGLHLTRRGGHLGVHADFNLHKRMNVERRLNLLIYLNEEWDATFGGALELWDRQMKAAETSILPVLGRAVVFNTDLDSFHGHPDPLNCPPERDRRSIATYYYTALGGGLDTIPARTTTFQTRPGSTDRIDWRVRIDHLIGDWVPPRLQRYARRLNTF